MRYLAMPSSSFEPITISADCFTSGRAFPMATPVPHITYIDINRKSREHSYAFTALYKILFCLIQPWEQR